MWSIAAVFFVLNLCVCVQARARFFRNGKSTLEAVQASALAQHIFGCYAKPNDD